MATTEQDFCPTQRRAHVPLVGVLYVLIMTSL
jgi:hypothetical protein